MALQHRLTLLVAASVLVACAANDEVETVRAPAVATAEVVARDLEECIDASGELVARLQTTLAAEVAGRVTKLAREEGDAVAEGEIILEIDPQRRELELEAARARVAKARAALEKERREVGRMRTLHQRNVASKAQLDEAETNLKLAQANAAAEAAQLGVASRALADASVAAPFAGLLSRRSVNVGQFVQPGTPLIELVSLDPIDVVFHVPEVDSGRVRVGQRVELNVAPYPDRSFEALVDVVSPTIDPETRTLRVKATLPNREGLLRPGLFAHADLGVALRRGVALVPEEAVLQRSDGSVIFVLVESDQVQRRVVTTGTFRDGQVEILAGAVPGDVVVTRGHTGLVDGSVVRVVAGPGSPRRAGLASAGGLSRDTL